MSDVESALVNNLVLACHLRIVQLDAIVVFRVCVLLPQRRRLRPAVHSAEDNKITSAAMAVLLQSLEVLMLNTRNFDSEDNLNRKNKGKECSHFSFYRLTSVQEEIILASTLV